jgi:hypothetical protein
MYVQYRGADKSLARPPFRCILYISVTEKTSFECLAEYFRGTGFDVDCGQLLSWRVLLSLVRDCTRHGKFLLGPFMFVIHKNRPFEVS